MSISLSNAMKLSLGNRRTGGGAAFSVSLSGLTNGEAIIGDHASIGYSTDPVSATETVKWSNSADPAAAATYGTGANPTDYTAGDEGRLYLHVTDGGETVTRSALIRYARGTAPSVADGREFTLDDLRVPAIGGGATGDNLDFTYAISGLPNGTINVDGFVNAAIPYTGTTTRTGTATITATDQYGLAYTDTFTWSATLRDQATAAEGLGPFSFTEDTAISNQDLSADFTAGGNTLTYTISPALPAGLSLASNGILSGTPTALATSATYTVTGQDEYGRETDSAFTLEVVEAGGLLDDVLALSGTKGVFDLGDTSTLYQNINDSTVLPVASNSDPVGTAENLYTGTGAIPNFSVDDVTKRPAFNTSLDGTSGTVFDGVDDFLNSTTSLSETGAREFVTFAISVYSESGWAVNDDTVLSPRGGNILRLTYEGSDYRIAVFSTTETYAIRNSGWKVFVLQMSPLGGIGSQGQAKLSDIEETSTGTPIDFTSENHQDVSDIFLGARNSSTASAEVAIGRLVIHSGSEPTDAELDTMVDYVAEPTGLTNSITDWSF